MQNSLWNRCAGLLVWATLLFLPGTSWAAVSLYEWRSEIGDVRMLAENDAPRAYLETQRLQAEQPPDATPADKVRLLNLLARVEAYLALIAQSDKHVKQALKQAELQGDRIGQAEALLTDVLNSINQAKFDNLLSATTRSVELLDGVDNPALLGEAMLRLSLAYWRFGQLDDSVTVAMNAMEIAEHSNNPLALTYAYQGLAVSYQLSGRYREARDNSLKMRDYARAARSRLLEAHAILNLALVADKLGEATEGERLMREALGLFRTTGMPFNVNVGLYNLADLLRNHGRDIEVVPILDEIVAGYETNPNPLNLWYALNARSKSLQALRRDAAARADAAKAHALAGQIGLPFFRSESAKRMAELAAAQGNHGQASRYYAEAIEMAEMADRKKIESRMLELVQRYRTESKQREIEELNRLHEQHIQWQHWLLSLLVGSLILLASSVFFIRRLRRSREEIRILNGGLEQRIETLLQQRNTEFHRLADNEPDPIFRYDRDCRRIYVNPAAERLSGKTASMLLGKPPCDMPFLPEEESIKVQQNVARVLKSGLPAENEVRHVAADGNERYFRNIYIPEFGLKGEVIGVLSIAHDIGERKAAEEALRASEERLRLFFERQLVGMAITSPEKGWIKVNDKACEMLGYSSDELNGLTWSELTHPDDLAADEAQFERMLRGEIDSYTLEKRFVRKDCGIVVANLSVGCVRRADHAPDYLLALLEDITERKRNAKELMAAGVILEAQNMQLHAYREKLEQRVEERTAELVASNQLLRVEIDERKQAERGLEELRSQLRGLLARREEAREEERKRIAREIHDELGQILSGLQLSVAHLSRQCGTDSPQMREYAEDAIELTNKAVLVARNVASALRPVELEVGIVAALQLQARRFSAVTCIQCKFAFDDNEIRLNECSALAVYRIVQESLTNVAKHAQAGMVEIGLCKNAGDFILKIRDNGIGFDTRVKKENSFGLVGIRERGLMLGGTVDINSSTGGGTEIVVRIPEGRNCD